VAALENKIKQNKNQKNKDPTIEVSLLGQFFKRNKSISKTVQMTSNVENFKLGLST